MSKYLSLLEKAYFLQSELAFERWWEAFQEEANGYLDSKGMSQAQEAEFSWEDLKDLEEFMDKKGKK